MRNIRPQSKVAAYEAYGKVAQRRVAEKFVGQRIAEAQFTQFRKRSIVHHAFDEAAAKRVGRVPFAGA